MPLKRNDKNYRAWLAELKQRIKSSQLKAAVRLNQEMLQLYWHIGNELMMKQEKHGWGKAVVETLANDLQKSFPEIKGFSSRNLFYMQRWIEFYRITSEKLPQAVAEIKGTKLPQAVAEIKSTKLPQAVAVFETLMFSIPWGHHRLLLDKLSEIEEAIWYLQQTNENGWSRAVLQHQIESNLYDRQKKNKKISNFKTTLPPAQSDLAEQLLKDPYKFDFIALGKDITERELEQSLVDQIAKFLIELGKGFAFVGKQYHLSVGSNDYYVDLLFYHLQLHCYVVIELKTGAFEPGHAGQILFYLNAVDKQLKTKNDNNTIGLILCKQRDKIVAEYALANISKPIGISEYKISHSIPKRLMTALPSVSELEKEFNKKMPTKPLKKVAKSIKTMPLKRKIKRVKK